MVVCVCVCIWFFRILILHYCHFSPIHTHTSWSPSMCAPSAPRFQLKIVHDNHKTTYKKKKRKRNPNHSNEKLQIRVWVLFSVLTSFSPSSNRIITLPRRKSFRIRYTVLASLLKAHTKNHHKIFIHFSRLSHYYSQAE